MWQVIEDRKYLKEQQDVLKQHFRSRNIQHLGINFMGLFPSSYGQHYILAEVDYMFKYVEAIVSTNVDIFWLNSLKKDIFSRYNTLWAIISDGRKYFYNLWSLALLAKYGVKYHVSLI